MSSKQKKEVITLSAELLMEILNILEPEDKAAQLSKIVADNPNIAKQLIQGGIAI